MTVSTVRYANSADIPALLPLLDQLGYPTSQAALEARFKRFHENPGFGVAVCTCDNEVVGFIAWSRSPLFIADKMKFHIDGLAVSAEYRSKGIGKKLIQFVEDIARKHRPSIVDLTSGLRRAKEGTHEFYKKLGYQNEGEMAKVYLRKDI